MSFPFHTHTGGHHLHADIYTGTYAGFGGFGGGERVYRYVSLLNWVCFVGASPVLISVCTISLSSLFFFCCVLDGRISGNQSDIHSRKQRKARSAQRPGEVGEDSFSSLRGLSLLLTPV